MGMFFPFAVCAVERRATVGSAVSHPGTGGVMGMLGSRKALCSLGGDWGAPCQSGLAFKGLSILSPGVGIMGSGHGSLSGKMIWDHYFCCHGNFIVQCFCISSVFGTCSRWVLILAWSVSCDPSLSFLGTIGCSLPPPLLYPLFSTGFQVAQVGLELAT